MQERQANRHVFIIWVGNWIMPSGTFRIVCWIYFLPSLNKLMLFSNSRMHRDAQESTSSVSLHRHTRNSSYLYETSPDNNANAVKKHLPPVLFSVKCKNVFLLLQQLCWCNWICIEHLHVPVWIHIRTRPVTLPGQVNSWIRGASNL